MTLPTDREIEEAVSAEIGRPLKSLLAEMEDVAGHIERTKPQGLLYDSARPSLQEAGRAILALLSRLSSVEGELPELKIPKCFECDGELYGPFCPACNPEIRVPGLSASQSARALPGAPSGGEPSADFAEWLRDQHGAMVGWIRANVNPIHYEGDPPEYWTICGEDDAATAITEHLLRASAASPAIGSTHRLEELESLLSLALGALTEIAELTERKQLPLTSHVNETASKAIDQIKAGQESMASSSPADQPSELQPRAEG